MPEIGKKNCKFCQTEISVKAKVCPNCKRKLAPNGCLTIIAGFFILIIVMAIIGSLGDNASDTKPSTPSNTTTSDNASTSSNTESTNVNSPAQATRDNSSAKETNLGAGSFIVGTDIPAGRYVCTAKGMGNFIIQEEEMPVVNEILGGDDYGVKSVTIDLISNQTINISGISNVNFKPAETVLKTELTTGDWVVGIDIEPGRYTCEPLNGTGNFFIYDSGFPVVNEILSTQADLGVPSVTANLKDGNIIKISGINTVKFTAK